MTEAEWRESDDPAAMLGSVRERASERKLRVFACNCCRRFWHLMGERGIPREVEIAEQFAEGEVELAQLRRIRSRLGARGGYSSAWAANQALHAVLADSALTAAEGAMQAALNFRYLFASEGLRNTNDYQAARERDEERASIAGLLREIFGNPFRPVAFDPAWRTDTAVSLAKEMYDRRDFGDMPILADALMDAGCDNNDILAHCRGTAPHVRGCWVVDLVLGRG